MNDFHDRLLDAGLRAYSQVAPPDNLAERAACAVPRRSWASSLADRWADRWASRWAGGWRWTLAPAAAALATVAVMIAMQPASLPGAPPRLEYVAGAPPVARVAGATHVRRRVTKVVGIRYRTLTASEMAHMDIPAGLLAPRVESPIVELQVQELSVKPLEGEKENERN